MIHMRDDIPKEDIPPWRRFVLTAPPPGCHVAKSSAAAARASRAADRADDVSYVRALQAYERRMMNSIEEVNLRVSYQVQARKRESEDFYTQLLDAQTDHKDIRLEIDVVKGHRTAYEIELQEVRQAYLSSEARNRALLARLETLNTHMSHMEWQHQRYEDDAVTQIMRTQVLEAKARIDTVEDVGSSFIITVPICIDIMIISHVHCILVIIRIMPVTRQGTNDAMTPESIQAMIDRAIQRNSTQDDESQSIVGLSHWLKKMESIFHISGCAVENQVKFATCTLLGAALTWWNGHKLKIELWNLKVRGNDVAAYTQRFQELTLMCTKFLADETAKIDKYIGGLPDNIHGNVMSARPKTLDFAIELANDLMDQKLHTYAERQNENKKKADDSSRNNQQPHKKQNVAKAYTRTYEAALFEALYGRKCHSTSVVGLRFGQVQLTDPENSPRYNLRKGSGYHQKDRKPSQNDKTEHGMEKTVQNQGQSPKMPKSESILKNTVGCNLNPSDGPGKPNSIFMKTVKTKWALNQFQQPICVQLTKTVKTLKAQS
ncbi:hypothetical protein Tco_0852261 [Tanacetum coccineum]